MIRQTTLGAGGALLTVLLALAACGGSSPATSDGAAAAPGDSATPMGATPGQSSSQAGKSLETFDPCSVVSDADLITAITAEAGDPSALGTITPGHKAVDGAATGLPGSKACSQTWTTTDSSGRVSQGGDPVIVTFNPYSYLQQLKGNQPRVVNDYQSSGAEAFEGPGTASPYITKNGYVFYMSGNSDSKLLKAIALGIASRL